MTDLVTIIVDARPGKTRDVVWWIGAQEGVVYVKPTKTGAGLIWVKTLPEVADVFVEVAQAHPDIEGAERGDQQVELNAQVTQNLTLARQAIKTEAGHAAWLAYQSKEGFRFPNWTELPRADSYVEEGQRIGPHIIFAIMDTGFDSTHPEFSGRTYTLVSDQHEDGPGLHGTFCASVAAGNTIGIMKDCELVDLKSFNVANSAGLQDQFRCLEDLRDWIDAPGNVGPDQKVVLSASLGAYFSSNVYTSIFNELWERGVFIFAASGNHNVNFDATAFDFYPAAALPEGAVGAVHLNGERTNFSSYGGVVSLYQWGFYPLAAGTAAGTGSGYSRAIGTSFACPLAAAAFATWVSSRIRPSGIAETRAVQAEWRDGFCVKGVLTDRYGLDLSNKAFALADNSPLANFVGLTPGSTVEVVLTYGNSPSYLNVSHFELIIEYEP